MFTIPAFLTGRSRSTITVHDRVERTLVEGLGFNWYPGYQADTYPADDDDARWGRLLAHADHLGMNFVRFGLGRCWADDGAFVPDRQSFSQLRRADAWAKKRGIHIMLDSWSIPPAFRFPVWEGAPTVWGNAPSPGVGDIDGYVTRFIVPLVRHAVQELGLSSITYFNHVNEPFSGDSYSAPPGIDPHIRYVEVIRAIRQGLDAAGLGHIGQIGPGCNDIRSSPIAEMIAKGHDPDPWLAAYDQHNYHTRPDWAPDADNLHNGNLPLSDMISHHLRPQVAHANARRRPFFMTEVGTFHYGWAWGDPAGIARHDNVINELAFCVESLRAGVDGALRWAWLNPGTHDGWWQLIETVDGSDRPLPDPYHGYATVFGHIGLRAKILPSEVTRGDGQQASLHAVAVDNPDGSRALIVVNDAYADPVSIQVNLPGPDGMIYRRIATDHVRKAWVDPRWRQTCAGGGVGFADVVSPVSITVYSSRL